MSAPRTPNTFEKHFAHFPEFVSKILAWAPDYVVPVAKKDASSLKASNEFNTIDRDLIKYRTYFELNNPTIKGKRIAVVDDATQYTATLLEYRRYFENLGATVKTFSFVWHENCSKGRDGNMMNRQRYKYSCPIQSIKSTFLQHLDFLLNHVTNSISDHLILETALPLSSFDRFIETIRAMGLLLFLEDYFLHTKTTRFSLNDVHFFQSVSYISHASISRPD